MNSIVHAEKRVIIKELVKGHEAATQLKILLQNPFGAEPSLSSQHLMANVLGSFTQALSIINSSSSLLDDVPHQNSSGNGLPVPGSGNDPTSENRSLKGGRGRYNRRKNEVSWTILSCTTDDNLAWRKYGQKGILNSQFPRSYYRCSHKYDQGCQAMKQVQIDQRESEYVQD